MLGASHSVVDKFITLMKRLFALKHRPFAAFFHHSFFYNSHDLPRYRSIFLSLFGGRCRRVSDYRMVAILLL